MANTSSAKGNPASTRMMNPNNKKRRTNNVVKNKHKEKGNGDIGVGNLRNAENNADFAKLKKHNHGYGQREVRRILSGKNQKHNIHPSQLKDLVLRVTDRHN